MESLTAETGIALVIGVILGYLFGMLRTKRASEPVVENDQPNRVDWWGLRESLTGTQLQILQYLESKKEASISKLQEKFSFIPDRELYYRLEQIYLMGFLLRDRKDGEVAYSLNPEYGVTVEDDKTVMMSGNK
ncbi:MAG: hypothetical protein WD356_07175 [Pseudomonadales bacterium]